MKIPAAVLARYHGVLETLDDPEQALHAALEQLREELEGAEALLVGAQAALPEAFPAGPPQPITKAGAAKAIEDGDWLKEDVEWGENVIRSGLLAVLDAVLGEAEHQGGEG